MDVLSILPQQLVFGLALGTVYGMIAIGYTMVYGVLFMINFATKRWESLVMRSNRLPKTKSPMIS